MVHMTRFARTRNGVGTVRTMIVLVGPSVVSACGSASPGPLGAASTPGTSTSPAPSSTTMSSTAPAAPGTWTARLVPAGVDLLEDVVCPSQTTCFAVGGMASPSEPGWIIGSSDAGHSWNLVDRVPPGDSLNAIACPSATECVAVGSQGPGQGVTANFVPLVVVTTDAGRHWVQVTVPARLEILSDVACATVTTCLAVGAGLIRTTDGGMDWTVVSTPGWTSPATPGPPAGIDSVTCPTASFCLIGGGKGAPTESLSAVSDNGGLSWSTAAHVAAGNGLGEVSCSSSQNCVGLAESLATNTYGTGTPVVTADGGHSWTRISSPVGGGLTCVGDFCISVGGLWQSATNTYPGDAFVSTDGGLSWTPVSFTTSQGLTSVAGTSIGHCVAVGGSFPNDSPGVIMTYGS
jgi:hypothetical protein